MNTEIKTLICNNCNTEKLITEFFTNHRRCKACLYKINKEYSKTYYQQNKKRLIDINELNYKIRNTSRGKIGRPRKHDDTNNDEYVLVC